MSFFEIAKTLVLPLNCWSIGGNSYVYYAFKFLYFVFFISLVLAPLCKIVNYKSLESDEITPLSYLGYLKIGLIINCIYLILCGIILYYAQIPYIDDTLNKIIFNVFLFYSALFLLSVFIFLSYKTTARKSYSEIINELQAQIKELNKEIEKLKGNTETPSEESPTEDEFNKTMDEINNIYSEIDDIENNPSLSEQEKQVQLIPKFKQIISLMNTIINGDTDDDTDIFSSPRRGSYYVKIMTGLQIGFICLIGIISIIFCGLYWNN